MRLINVQKNHAVKIISIHGDSLFRKRIYSFGIFENSIVCVINVFIAKQTIQLQNEDGTMFALRLQEAKNIEVGEVV